MRTEQIIQAVAEVTGTSVEIITGKHKSRLMQMTSNARQFCQFIMYVHLEMSDTEVAKTFDTSRSLILKNVKTMGRKLARPAIHFEYTRIMDKIKQAA